MPNPFTRPKDSRSSSSNNNNKGLQVTCQQDSVEVASFSHLEIVPRLKTRSSRHVTVSGDDLEENIAIGDGNDHDSVLSEGFTSRAEESSMNDRARRIRHKSNMKWYLRLLLLMIATLIGFFISGVVYYATRLAEADSFEAAFADLSLQFVNSAQEEMAKKFLALDGLSIALTSHATTQAQLGLGTSWPEVTLPDFATKATNVLVAAESKSIVMAPLVMNDTLMEWNTFLAANTGEWRSGTETQAIVIEEARSSVQGLAKESNASFRVWQHQPSVPGMINADLLSPPTTALLTLLSSHQALIGDLIPVLPHAYRGFYETTHPLNHYLSNVLYNDNATSVQGFDLGILVSNIYYPIFDSLIIPGFETDTTRSLVGLLTMDIVWQDFLASINVLSTDEELICVLRTLCGEDYTFTVRYDRVVHVREGDFHDPNYNNLMLAVQFDNLEDLVKQKGSLQAEMDNFCIFEIKIYPSHNLEAKYLTFKPAVYTASAAFCFLVIFFLSLAYERRVAQVHESAVQYRAVVSNLFPPAVRDRMFRQQEEVQKVQLERQRSVNFGKQPSSQNIVPGPPRPNPPAREASYMPLTDVHDLTLMPSKPIADHFPNSTIMFADIAGFTSWSSARRPEHVFTLLQSLFNLFDGIAKKRRVFKVETIGDCYLAVTGVPEVQPDHALRMTKFARECLYRVRPLLDRLCSTLGPGTADLAIRIGLHSGPVTAGVLQGEKSRFQLFGDTVNTASRMESNGQPGRIHISRATADLLIQAQKSHWLEKREDPIHAKGKGLMETYWIRPYKGPSTKRGKFKLCGELSENSDNSDSEGYSDSELLLSSFTSATSRLSDTISDSSFNESSRELSFTIKDLPVYSSHHAEKDLIEWHVKTLTIYLEQMIRHRTLQGGLTRSPLQGRSKDLIRASCPFDELSETIPMPNPVRPRSPTHSMNDKDNAMLSDRTVHQLRDFVTIIAQSYRQNHFHNFARATHTAMFMHKFLQEIHKRGPPGRHDDCLLAVDSDPQIQLALMFAALIHDADHPGVPNDQLAQERPDFLKVYKGRLLAEQHALELSWELITDKGFEGLQKCLFSTRSEMLRFRQIMVNLVLATDQSDKELIGVRSLRWEEGFSSLPDVVPGKERLRLKISVLIEILLQAADLSHTMQPWDIYLRWTKKQYMEVHEAYFTGRSDVDPEKTWYARQAFVFDRQAIPLAQKLATVTGWDSLLDKIRSNRQEWISSGKVHVKNFAAEAKVMKLTRKKPHAAFGNGSSNSMYRFSLRDE